MEWLGKEKLRLSRATLSELQLQRTSWPNLFPMFQLALNHSTFTQQSNIAPLGASTTLEESPPIATFLRSTTSETVTIPQALHDLCFNIFELFNRAEELHPIVQCSLALSWRSGTGCVSKKLRSNCQIFLKVISFWLPERTFTKERNYGCNRRAL